MLSAVCKLKGSYSLISYSHCRLFFCAKHKSEIELPVSAYDGWQHPLCWGYTRPWCWYTPPTTAGQPWGLNTRPAGHTNLMWTWKMLHPTSSYQAGVVKQLTELPSFIVERWAADLWPALFQGCTHPCVDNDGTQGGMLRLTSSFIRKTSHPVPASTSSSSTSSRGSRTRHPGSAFDVLPVIIHPWMTGEHQMWKSKNMEKFWAWPPLGDKHKLIIVYRIYQICSLIFPSKPTKITNCHFYS